MQDIKVPEEEMKKLSQFADSEGQVKQRRIVKTLQQHKVCFVFNTIKFSLYNEL